jgi:hypothetical protein
VRAAAVRAAVGAATEISYLLARPYWGKGYATESAGAVLRLAFGRLKIDRLFAHIQPGNGPSARVAERLAFRRPEPWRTSSSGPWTFTGGIGRGGRMNSLKPSIRRPARPGPAPAVDARRLRREADAVRRHAIRRGRSGMD